VVFFTEVPGAAAPRSAWDPAALRSLGARLAQLHRAGLGFSPPRPNLEGPEQVGARLARLAEDPRVVSDAALAAGVAAFQGALAGSAATLDSLPEACWGVCHCDLFPDNVHFVGGRATGLLDLEMSATAPFIYDLAITLIVWAWDGAFSPPLAQALVAGYEAHRPLAPVEGAALFDAARLAAARFGSSRIETFALAPPELKMVRKDWRRFRDRLRDLEALGPAGLRALVWP